MKAKTRRIVVDSVEYRWGVRGSRARFGRAAVSFTAYLADTTSSPLHVDFVDAPGVMVGEPCRGWIVMGGVTHDLDSPRVAAELIRLALARGWTPARPRCPFEHGDGIAWLRELDSRSGA